MGLKSTHASGHATFSRPLLPSYGHHVEFSRYWRLSRVTRAESCHDVYATAVSTGHEPATCATTASVQPRLQQGQGGRSIAAMTAERSWRSGDVRGTKAARCMSPRPPIAAV